MRSYCRALVLLFICAAGMATVNAQQENFNWSDARANSDYYRYRNDPSFSRPDQLLRTVEFHHLPQAMQFLAAGSYPFAYEHFVFILAAFPNHPQALLGLEELCRKWKSPKCTLEGLFERAIAVNPEASGTYIVQGIYLARNGQLQSAVKSYQRALELAPNSANAHYNLGLAHVELKQYDLAAEHAQKAYALGIPLKGLREKLIRAGKWRAPDPAYSAAPKPDSGGGASSRVGEAPTADK